MLLPRSQPLVLLMAATALLLVCVAGRTARADLVWGSISVNSGPSVYDWEIADWIDDYFEDGSKGDGSVGSNMIIVDSACYGGDVHDNFNGTTGEAAGGAAFDSTGFSNTTVMSGSSAGKVTFTGGYDGHAAGDFKPGNTTGQAHDAGTAGRVDHDVEYPAGSGKMYPAEDPQISGSATKTIGGATSTHLLIWAGKPGEQDQGEMKQVFDNFNGKPGAEVTVLSGDGSNVAGGPPVNNAATLDNLKQALQNIGGKMDDGADEQFILWVSDHGNKETIKTNAAPLLPSSTQLFSFNLSSGDISDWTNDPLNKPTLSLWTADPLSPTDRNMLRVSLEGHDLGPLAAAFPDTVDLPDGSHRDRYTFTLFDESLFDPFASTDLTLANLATPLSTLAPVFDTLVLGSGDIAQPAPVPEPSTAALLAAAAALLLIRSFQSMASGRRRP